jgi:serine-aspartate repeat-containing protein C/D/E
VLIAIGAIAVVALGAGSGSDESDSSPNKSAALISEKSEIAASSRIAVHVVADLNGNGRADEDEPGAPGIEVRLSGAREMLSQTNANGDSLFENLARGNYNVEAISYSRIGGYGSVTLPSGLLTVESDKQSAVAFAIYPPFISTVRAIYGRVFRDTNKDRDYQESEAGLPGMVVTLDGTSYSTTTNQKGDYWFYNLPPGAYSVVVSGPDFTGRSHSIPMANLNRSLTVWFPVP